MTNEVEILIRGAQHYGDGHDEEPVILETKGVYRQIAGRHHIRYDEVISGTTETTRNHIAIAPNRIEVNKRGEVKTTMVFEEGKTHETRYETRFGTLVMQMRTKKLTVREHEHSIHTTIWYDLLANGEKAAECTMEINIKER